MDCTAIARAEGAQFHAACFTQVAWKTSEEWTRQSGGLSALPELEIGARSVAEAVKTFGEMRHRAKLTHEFRYRQLKG